MLIVLGCLIFAAIVIMLSMALSLCPETAVDYRVYSKVKSVAQTKTVVSRDHGSGRASDPSPNRSGSTVVASPAPAPEVAPVEAAESAPEVAPVEAAESAPEVQHVESTVVALPARVPEVQHINDVTTPKFAEFGDKEAA
jgi:hypothetical protein